MRAFVFTMLLLACDPEDVGVRLPQGGVDAVVPLEIRNDLWSFTDPRLGGRAPGSSGAKRVARALAERFQVAHLEPGFGESYQHDLGPRRGTMVCGRRPGGGAGAIAVVALDPGVGVLSAVPIAALTGLAKASDGQETLSRTYVFCLLPEAGGLDGYLAHPPHPLSTTVRMVILGSLSGESLRTAPGPDLSGLPSEIWHTGPLAATLGDDMGRLDFESIATQVRAVYLRLEGREAAPAEPAEPAEPAAPAEPAVTTEP